MTYEHKVKKEFSVQDVVRHSTTRWHQFDKGFHALFALITVKTNERGRREDLGYNSGNKLSYSINRRELKEAVELSLAIRC
jgi:hypothetical protein